MSVPRPPARRQPPPPPPPKRQQQQRQQQQQQQQQQKQQQQKQTAKAQSRNKTANAKKEPSQSKTASILRLIPEPNQQPRRHPTTVVSSPKKYAPPARGYRNPVPADIENWLDTTEHWQHTSTANAHVAAVAKKVTAAATARTPLQPRHPHVAQQQQQLNRTQVVVSGPGNTSRPRQLLDPSSTSAPPSSDGNLVLAARQLQPQPRVNIQLVRLQNAVHSSREAETLHAYDVGVLAALQSMLIYWNGRAEEMQTSSAEKRIFLREAQRLTDLMDGAERKMLISNAVLVNRQEREEGLWDGALVESSDSQFVSVYLSPPALESNATVITAWSWEIILRVDEEKKTKKEEKSGNDGGGQSAKPGLSSEDSDAYYIESSKMIRLKSDLVGSEEEEWQAVTMEDKEKSQNVQVATSAARMHTKSVSFLEGEEWIDEDEDDFMSDSDFEDLDCSGI